MEIKNNKTINLFLFLICLMFIVPVIGCSANQVDQVEGIIGTYEPGSKKLDQVTKDSGYIVISYYARYTGESEDVLVTISLQKTGDKIEIAGSWFNSPKLRGE